MFQRSPMKLAAGLAILLACGCGDDSSAPIVDDPEAPPVFQYTIGRSREGRVMYPSSIDLDAQGNIYLVNEGSSYDGNEIYKMDARGHFIKNWPLYSAVIGGGSASSSRLEAKSEADFAGRAYSSLIVSGNTIVAADHSRRRIIRFDLEGNILDSWGKYGTGDGEFRRLQDVAEDAEGNVYALDGESYRVQKFSADGTFLLQWGRQGTRPGEFETATGLAVDPAGFVYVGDLELQRIQKFDLQGVFLEDWPIEVQPTRYGVEIVRLSLDNEGHLLVLSDGDRLSKWSSDGVLLDEWGIETEATSSVYCVDVAVDSNNNLLFVEMYEHMLSRFTADGSFLGTLANDEPNEADVEQIQAIAVNSRGSLLVASDYSRLSEFSRTGEFVSTRNVLGEVGGGRIEKILAASLSNVYLLMGEAFHRLVPGGTAELLPGQPIIPEGLRRG
jgi:tripartite motif-containing protein 71